MRIEMGKDATLAILGSQAADRSEWKDCKDWFEIQGKECLISLEPRPVYCDRGNFAAKLQPWGKLAHDIDDADGWNPCRYYFDFEIAKKEVEAWLKKRGQWMS